jgi:hypothetical protein
LSEKNNLFRLFRIGRVVAETEKNIAECFSNIAFAIVVLPQPLGAAMTINLPETINNFYYRLEKQ